MSDVIPSNQYVGIDRGKSGGDMTGITARCPKCHRIYSMSFESGAIVLMPVELQCVTADWNAQVGGYRDAFYQIGELLGLTAMPISPKEVFETVMIPRLRQLVAAETLEIERLQRLLDAALADAAFLRGVAVGMDVAKNEPPGDATVYRCKHGNYWPELGGVGAPDCGCFSVETAAEGLGS